MNKENLYKDLVKRIDSLIEGETDVITIMSTICCELFHAFEHWNFVGFYRLIDEQTLKVGPYQGTHGCLTIDINQGVCGKCAREQKVQIENDVSKLLHHIACSSETKSEIVIPIFEHDKNLYAVMDIDSVILNSFDEIDERYLSKIVDNIYLLL